MLQNPPQPTLYRDPTVPTYLLHIGSAKTGTSALQRFLSLNAARLARSGVMYPRAGRDGLAHHTLAAAFNPQLVSGASTLHQARMTAALDALRAETANYPGTVLLSSEGFQNVDPNALRETFPPASTRVVVYLRDQLEYAISAYQQQVQVRDVHESLAGYAAPRAVDYDRFLSAWEAAYGREHLVVRAYDRTRLLHGDIVHDFMHCAGLPLPAPAAGAPARPAAPELNPSIGGALLEAKRLLNHAGIPQPVDRPLFTWLSARAAQSVSYRCRPVLPPHLAQMVRERSAASNRAVFDRFFAGEDVFARHTPALPEATVTVPPDMVRDVLEALRAAQQPAVPATAIDAALQALRDWPDEASMKPVAVPGRVTPNSFPLSCGGRLH